MFVTTSEGERVAAQPPKGCELEELLPFRRNEIGRHSILKPRAKSFSGTELDS